MVVQIASASSRDGAVEHVALNRPDVRNAFDEEMIRELTWWADSVAADRGRARRRALGRRPGVLRRRRPAVDGADGHATRPTRTCRTRPTSARMFLALDRCRCRSSPACTARRSAAASGLCAVCDIVVAADDAVFGFTEVKLGIIPAVISPFVLAKIGRSAARELFLTGARFSAARAAIDRPGARRRSRSRARRDGRTSTSMNS